MTDSTVVTFNPWEPGFFDDPYRQYGELRAHDPVHHSPLEVWVLFRYDDVVRGLRDPTLSADIVDAAPNMRTQIMQAAAAERLGDRADRGARAMLGLDPPDHTRLRRLVSKAFTPKTVEQLRPRIQELVDDTLDRVAAQGSMDVVADLAFPLPFAVISEMLGMPDGNRDEVRAWSHAMTKTLDPVLLAA